MGDGTFNRSGWERILNNHGGYLPVRIRAVPEGSVIPTGNVLMTIENADSELAWVINFAETLLLKIWYGSTVATLSRENKMVIAKYLNETGNINGLPFALHDFGYRGVATQEQAAIGGAAHLINFKGSDTMAAIEFIQQYYSPLLMPAFSIPASEHSTITAWGRENESKAYENMLDTWPNGLLACVSDSYDIMNACENIWGGVLKDKVMGRDGVLIVRPDSGDPVEITLKVVEALGSRFGYTINTKGYKVLDPHVRIIQGDGIDMYTIPLILENFKKHGWSANNIAFGSGGGLLQKVNRDTSKYAIKCSYAEVNGEPRDVYKQPATDSGKSSKRGRLKLVRNSNSEYNTVSESADGEDILHTVFEDGKLMIDDTFENIR